MSRKRKLSESENTADQADSAPVPEKSAKLHDADSFSVVKFISDLDKEENPIDEVQRFKDAAELFDSGGTTVDVVDQFLTHTQGNIRSIANLIQKQKSTTPAVTLLYRCLELLMQHAAEKGAQMAAAVVGSVQQALQQSKGQLERSLARSRSKAHHVQATLRMLTTLAMLGAEGARHVAQVVDLGAEHFRLLLQWRNPADPHDVRTCAVYLLLAIMATGRNAVVRQILTYKGLANTIFPGLVYDRASFICNFLLTLKLKVGRNMSLSKTTKMRFLNDKTLKYVVQLLSWQGPREWHAVGKWKKFGARKSANEDEEARAILQVSEEDITAVQTSAYEFLREVCCDYKTGIVFRDSSLGLAKNPNPILTGVLHTGTKHYKCPRGRDFLADVLRACPDQILHYLRSWMPLLSNASAPSAEEMIHVLMHIVEAQDVVCRLQGMVEKSPAEVCSVVSLLSLLEFVPCITESQCLQAASDGLGIHLTHMKFVLASVGKVYAALHLVQERSFAPSLNAEEREKMFSLLTDTVWHNVPPASQLVSKYKEVANRAVSAREVLSTGSDERELLARVRGLYCGAILDVLELYVACASGQASSIVEREERLSWQSLAELARINTQNLDADAGKCLQLRALQLVIDAAPSLEALFSLEESSPFRQLLQLLTHGTDEAVKKSASSLVMRVLCKLSVLELYGWEMDVWMEKLRRAQQQHASLGKLLMGAVCLLLSDPNAYNDQVMQCVAELGGQEQRNTINLREILEMSTTVKAEPEEMSSFEAGRYFSPLLPAMLEALQSHPEPACRQYVDAVVVEILHYQQQPQVLCSFLESSAAQLSPSILHYANIWSPCGTKKSPAVPEHNAFSDPLVSQLAAIFVGHVSGAGKKRSSKLPGNLDKVKDALPASDACGRRSLFRQMLLYVTVLFEREQLLPLVPHYLGVSRAILDCSLNVEEAQVEDHVQLVDFLLRHETTLTWYLNAEVSDSALKVAALQYTHLILDTVLKLVQKCPPSSIAQLAAPLHLLKDRTVRTFSSASVSFYPLWSQAVETFAGMLSQQDAVALLEAALAAGADAKLDAIRLLLETLSEWAKREQYPEALLSSVSIRKLLTWMLDCTDQTLCSEEGKKAFEDAVLRLFASCPIYAAAVEKDDLERLASGTSSVDLLSFLIEQSPVHRRLLLKMASAQQLHLHRGIAPSGMATLLCSLFRSLAQEEEQMVDDELGSWVVKRFLKLPKHLCAMEGEVSTKTVTDAADVLSSLLRMKLLGKKESFKLLDTLGDATHHCLQLVLLNRLCKGLTKSFKKDFRDSLLQHLLSCISRVAEKVAGPEIPAPHVLEELQRAVTVLRNFTEDSFVRVACRDKLWQQSVMSQLKAAFRSYTAGSVVFALLSAACEKVYQDGNSANVGPSVCDIYMMLLGHSKFLPLMLESNAEAQAAKGGLIQLMTTLVQCDHRVCELEHVPLFLSAYGATLSIVDQRLLYLLYLYEENGVDLCAFKPYMWGPSAVSFYSVYKKSSRSLLKQPKTEEILGLFHEETMTSSLLKFPLTLDLQPFPQEDVADKSVYDPRFVLSLLYSLLSPGSLVHCGQFVEMRCLAYVFHSLCSEVFQVRALGFNLLSLFYQHLEGSRYSNSAFWLCVLESLRNALTVRSARLPCLLVGYLSNAAQVIQSPAHDAFNPVLNFLLAKPMISIDTVPDFYKMFFNQSVKHRFRRMWFLEVMADNLRSSLDFHVCNNRYVLGILEAYFISPVCRTQAKELVLKILTAAVKIPKAARALCREQGLLAWVSSALARNADDANVTRMLFGIVHHVWECSSTPTLTYMDKMAAALKKEHEAISHLVPEHTSETGVLRGHHEGNTLPSSESTDNVCESLEEELRTVVANRRFYDHFPFEYLLALCDMCKYIRHCRHLDTVTQYVRDMSDALHYVHSKASAGQSITEHLFCPSEILICNLLHLWDIFSNQTPAEGLNLLGRSIAEVCHYWLPPCDGSELPEQTWIKALDFVLQKGSNVTPFNRSAFEWLFAWLKGGIGTSPPLQRRQLELITRRAKDLLDARSGSEGMGCEMIVIDVLVMLLDRMRGTEFGELRPAYCKAKRSMDKKQLTDKEKAMATTLLFQELLLQKPKPVLSGTYLKACQGAQPSD